MNICQSSPALSVQSLYKFMIQRKYIEICYGYGPEASILYLYSSKEICCAMVLKRLCFIFILKRNLLWLWPWRIYTLYLSSKKNIRIQETLQTAEAHHLKNIYQPLGWRINVSWGSLQTMKYMDFQILLLRTILKPEN